MKDSRTEAEKLNYLANVFYRVIMKEDNPDPWELANKLARLAQGRKSFAKFYNSPEARKERSREL